MARRGDAAMLVCGGAQAKIHEEAPLPGLDKGVLVHFEKDTDHKIPYGPGKTIGTGDFSVVCHVVLPAGPPVTSATIALLTGLDEVASHNPGARWMLMFAPDGSLFFTAQPKEGPGAATINAPKGSLTLGHAHDIVVSVHREARQPLSGIWVDGIEIASGTFAPIDLRASLPTGDWNLSGWVKSVTVYDRALTRPEILDLMLRSAGAAADQPKPKHPAPPANGPRFVPQPDETIALIGGTEAAALAESVELEAMLLVAFPNTRFHFRNLAWEGDTVFKQDRPMNFGSLEQQLRRVNAGAVMVMFGRQECLDHGKEGVEEFKEAFGKLMEVVAKVAPNVVVIGPAPFGELPPPMPNLSAKNEALSGYRSALSDWATQHGAVYVDGSPREDIAKLSDTIAADGVQMTP